jgi:hypothetical protein
VLLLTFIKRWFAHLTNQPLLASISKWKTATVENENYGIQRNKFEHDVERIFSHYKQLGGEYSRNPTHPEGMTNVGSDMILGVSYADESI